jgi:predicted HTH transcriptional regulator
MHHIERLISEGEHQMLDFKYGISDAGKIARSLVAFANTDGGRLLVGVRDNGSLAGVRSEEEFYMVDTAAKMFCNPEVAIKVKNWNLYRKNILEVTIPKSSFRPHFALQEDKTWMAYHRVGDQNFPVNRILLRVWKFENDPRDVVLQFTAAEKFLLAHLEQNQTITVSKFTRSAGIKKSKAEQILVKMILLKLIDMHFTENLTFFTLHGASVRPVENAP